MKRVNFHTTVNPTLQDKLFNIKELWLVCKPLHTFTEGLQLCALCKVVNTSVKVYKLMRDSAPVQGFACKLGFTEGLQPIRIFKIFYYDQ